MCICWFSTFLSLMLVVTADTVTIVVIAAVLTGGSSSSPFSSKSSLFRRSPLSAPRCQGADALQDGSRTMTTTYEGWLLVQWRRQQPQKQWEMGRNGRTAHELAKSRKLCYDDIVTLAQVPGNVCGVCWVSGKCYVSVFWFR